MNLGNPDWLNTDVQARIEPPPIPLIRVVTEKVED